MGGKAGARIAAEEKAVSLNQIGRLTSLKRTFVLIHVLSGRLGKKALTNF